MPRTGLCSEEIKEKAVEHAIIRMRHSGFEKVRLSDIAKDLGVSHAALYGHFKDKSALLDAVSERWLEQLDSELEQYCEPSELSALDRIQNWCIHLHRAKRKRGTDDPELYQAFSHSSDRMKPFVIEHLVTSKRQLSTLVEQAMNRQEITPQSIETVVTLLQITTIGFHHPRLVMEFLHIDQEATLQKALAVLFQGLGQSIVA